MFDEIREERIKKLELLKKKGINPYPSKTSRTHTISSVLSDFNNLENKGDEVTIAGRIMAKRGQGAIVFVDLYDGTGRLQGLLKSDEMESESYQLFTDTIDIGDFVEVSGNLFATKRGEQTIQVKNWNILSKSLSPLPDKWHGIKDEEGRYRKRYLDMLLNEEVADIVHKKSLFWNTIRDFLLERAFVEVETPVLENTTGGAEAKPFITHHNALDLDVYLRISAGELWQKKLMVAGIPRTFEIGRIFRNEGMSATHLQDYTQLEFYQAYSDYEQGMKMVRELYIDIAKKVFGKTTFTIGEYSVDLSKEWELYHFSEIMNEKFGIDPSEKNGPISEDDLVKACTKAGIDHKGEGLNKTRLIDLLWKSIRKDYSGPGFLVGVPVYLEPLAKKSEDNSNVVDRFQVIIAGSEVGKGFSELNDPIDQKERFLAQQKLRDAGDEEAQMADMEFVEALEYGMPPTFGFGLSERLFSFLMDKSVRETQLFPLMRPKEE